MGTLDDAIREHLELQRRKGADEEELKQKEVDAFGPVGPGAARPPQDQALSDPVREEPTFDGGDYEPESRPEPAAGPPDQGDPWAPPGDEDDLLADEVLPEDSLESNGAVARSSPPPVEDRAPRDDRKAEEPHEDPLDEWEEEPEPPEDVLEETPEFLEETPEHDRLWFEQRPPKDFDFD